MNYIKLIESSSAQEAQEQANNFAEHIHNFCSKYCVPIDTTDISIEPSKKGWAVKFIFHMAPDAFDHDTVVHSDFRKLLDQTAYPLCLSKVEETTQ